MHKTIGLNHGFVHTVLYVCFLCKTEYKMKIHKIKAYDNSSSGKLIVSYLGGTRFKTLVEPLCIQKNISRPMFYIYKCLCNGQLSSHYMFVHTKFRGITLGHNRAPIANGRNYINENIIQVLTQRDDTKY